MSDGTGIDGAKTGMDHEMSDCPFYETDTDASEDCAAMCPDCEDFARTVLLLGQLALYADTTGADLDFVDVVSPSLAASLPEPPTGEES